MPEPATRPEQSLLLVAVPLDESEFRSAWRAGSDYLSGAYANVDTGWSAYAKSAALAQRICREAEALGATVVAGATLEALAGAAGFRAITVLAHMNFPRVAVEDVLDAEELARLVERGEAPEWRRLEAELGDRKGVTDVVAALNRLLEATHRDLASEPVEDAREARRLARHRRQEFGLLRFDRPRLDELCGPAVLRPGKGVEMADRMVTAAEFVAAIPPGYDGFLDLRMCSSLSLGAAVRRARPDLWVAVGKRMAFTDAALLLYETALLYMAQQQRIAKPVSYKEAMMSLTEAAL